MIIRKTRIRIRILGVFFVMLLLSFSLTGIIFNIIVSQYIQNSAGLQLDEIYNNMLRFMDGERIHIIRPPAAPIDATPFEELQDSSSLPPIRRSEIRISVNVFVIDEAFNLAANQDVNDEMLKILQVLRMSGPRLSSLRNILIRTDGEAYYVSAFPTPENERIGRNYFIVYADVTGLLFFAATINTFLIVLVCVMFIISIFATFFLSNSITNPIEKLGLLASRIGQGDFTPSDFSFIDEEFENLNRALNNSARQLSIYDSNQKTFFQNVSHELRTPLMSIQCHAEGIAFGIMDNKKASETILQETNRLTELVTELLYISKIDNITTAYENTKVDLHEILRSCVQRQQSVAEKKGIRFSFDFTESAIEYKCVEKLVSRAVDNLISNAIRYASSEIILSCRRNQYRVTIGVADDGEGIKPESLPYIFDRFYKSEGGNYGIGLAIVKTIAEQHHGSVTAGNRENGGALFTIILPCELPHGSPHGSQR